RRLWQLCEKVSHRAKAAGQCGTGVTLKLKTKDFRIRTRSAQLSAPSNLAAEVFQHAQRLLAQETTGTAFRLIGIGLTGLEQPGAAQQQPQQQTLLSDPAPRHHVVEQALDAVRGKFGPHAIDKGRGFAPKQK
ncbi:MAG TPA: DNA polymerase IV, partial [Alphaproteobacteria bacterium]|nr:DNA polymerase IV [Alphaproteobacteria bacterium]